MTSCNSSTAPRRRVLVGVLLATGVSAFAPQPLQSTVPRVAHKLDPSLTRLRAGDDRSEESVGLGRRVAFGDAFATAALAAAIVFSPLGGDPNSLRAHAYDPSDYASETVTAAVSSLNDAAGDVSKTFKTFEDIAAIITEGKGVGGSLNYNGIQLERGFISDEDTSIYNPGLSLLTESEKERLVDAIVKNRKIGLQKNAWNDDNELGFDFLKGNLDPLHMYELKGYLGILPFYGAAVYLATFFVQQNFRNIFPVAYIIGAVAVFGPIAALIVAGP